MKSTEDILEINKRQKEFYNSDSEAKTNFVSILWFKFRNGVLSEFRNKFDIKDQIYDQRKTWFRDLSEKKILY